MIRAVPQFSSVRMRLTLWNTGVMALVLAILGVTVQWSARAVLLASVDRELSMRSRRPFGMNGPRPGPFPWPMPPAPPPPGRGPQGNGPDGRPPWMPPPNPFHPRILDLRGRSIGPLRDEPPWDLHAFEQAVRGATLYSTIEGNDGPARILSFPMIDRGELVAVAQIPHPLADTYRALNGLARTLLTLIPVALLIAAVGGAFLTDRALRPVRQISETAGRIGSKDLSERLAVAGNDEFSELSSTFNGMLARLEESFQRMEGILEQQRRFTGDASHELRTPLTIIKANTTLVLRGERPSADYIRSLKSIDRAADTMGGIVQDLLLLARSDGGQLGQNSEITPVSELIARATEVVRSSQAPSTSLGTAPPVRVDVADASLSVIGNPDELTRMFSNIVENAARHTPPDGQILIHAIGQDGHVQVKVEDTGEGIPPEHLPHVCERFYRADDARARDRGGTGLGLAICKSIAEAHKGSLEIRSAPGEGTTVLIRLPRFLVEDTEL